MPTTPRKTTPRKTTKKETPVAEQEFEAPEAAVQVVGGEGVLLDVPTDASVDGENTVYPKTRAAFEKHGLDPEGVPSINALFDTGYIRIRGDENFGFVTSFELWPTSKARDEILQAYNEDRS